MKFSLIENENDKENIYNNARTYNAYFSFVKNIQLNTHSLKL